MKKKLKKQNGMPEGIETEDAKFQKGQPETETKDIISQRETHDSTTRKLRKWPIITAACFFVLLIGVYGSVAIYYHTHFLPGTTINGVDCSGMETSSVTELLDAQIMDYSIEVTGRDYATGAAGARLGIISASDIQMSFQATIEDTEQILNEQNMLLWITNLFPHEYSFDLVRSVSYDIERLEAVVKSWSACQSNNMVKAQDAYISEYSEELQGYEIIPETTGTELDVERVILAITAAIEAHELSLDLDTAEFYKAPKITKDDAKLIETVETANLWLSTEITYDWNGTEVILNLETLKDWVSIEDGKAVLDEDAVSAFVKSQARQYDTYGKTKNFITTLGVEMTLRSPSYGWWTDTESETAELIELIKNGSNVEREPVYLRKGVRKGINDLGSSYVEADLTHQHLYLYQNGELVLETDFVSGNMSWAPENHTPQGIFGVTYKTTNAILRGGGTPAHVDYWMPFYGDYGMHDAKWRSEFGGTIYMTDGSHGCINLPLDMAEQIYQYVYTGSPVVCYYYPEPEIPADQMPEEQNDEEW